MTETIWAIIPAAGAGTRLNSSIPKQYLNLDGRSVLARSITSLRQDERIGEVAVGINRDDHYIEDVISTLDTPVRLFEGGASRRDTVLNGLRSISEEVAAGDWVLVHDAARPLLAAEDLRNLVDYCLIEQQGAILVAPSTDTLKKSIDGQIVCETLDRDQIWRALTPQCFRFADLYSALLQQDDCTDEAQAVERYGKQVGMVKAQYMNSKITYKADLQMAELIIRQALGR